MRDVIQSSITLEGQATARDVIFIDAGNFPSSINLYNVDLANPVLALTASMRSSEIELLFVVM